MVMKLPRLFARLLKLVCLASYIMVQCFTKGLNRIQHTVDYYNVFVRAGGSKKFLLYFSRRYIRILESCLKKNIFIMIT